jgi:hypothetical protein
MVSEETNYIEILSSYLENEDLHHIIENFDNNRDDVLLVIKNISSYDYISNTNKFLTNEEKSQCVEEKFSEFCDPMSNYRYTDDLKNEFRTVIFICVFTENRNEFYRLEDDLPKPNFSFHIGNLFWSSERSLTNSLFIEGVEKLVSTVYLKPAKRN